jgi:hypothetical protein
MLDLTNLDAWKPETHNGDLCWCARHVNADFTLIPAYAPEKEKQTQPIGWLLKARPMGTSISRYVSAEGLDVLPPTPRPVLATWADATKAAQAYAAGVKPKALSIELTPLYC